MNAKESTIRTEQDTSVIVPRDIAERLLFECLGQPESHNALRELCDSIGGRASGSPAGQKAEEWAHALLTRWGLQNVHYEEIPVVTWARGTLDATIAGPAGWTLSALAHGNSPQQADVSAPVIDLEFGEREDFEKHGAGIAGKVVLCDEHVRGGHTALHRSEKLAMAVEYGAKALMIMSASRGMPPKTGVCLGTESPIASLGIAAEDGLRLRRLLATGKSAIARIVMTNHISAGTSRNVIAEIPGAENPREVVLAGAHLDSWDVGQGALDNGMGSVTVLESARALAACGKRPRRTIRFALWGAEEIGLLGSMDYVNRHRSELDDLVAVMNFDETGAPFGYNVQGRNEPGELIRGLAKQLAPLGMRNEFWPIARLHSDHQYFLLEGVPVIMLLASIEDAARGCGHTSADTLDKVSMPGLCRASAVAAHTLWALADEPERSLKRYSPTQVGRIIRDYNHYEGLKAEGYSGPAMDAACPESA